MLFQEALRQNHEARRRAYTVRPHRSPMAFGEEIQDLRKDGSLFPAEIMLSIVETAEGQAVLCVVRDISKKIRLQEESERKERERHFFEQELNADPKFEDIVGVSEGLRRVLREVETISATDATVLILGETGTGKDVIARAIHQLSSGNERNLITLKCASIPTRLIESELFGHEKGSFTGAVSPTIGRLELALQRTLVLDEIGNLPLELGPKLPRVLQEKKFERLGETRAIPVDLRLIVATNCDLRKMLSDRQFRSDLHYRLKVFPITLPPLRERREDIPFLVRYFVSKHAHSFGRQIETIAPDLMKALSSWDWPGNIRELKNFIERSVILTKGTILRAPLAELVHIEEAYPNEDSTLESIQEEHIVSVRRETRRAISGAYGAATRLGLKQTTLNSKLKKFGSSQKTIDGQTWRYFPMIRRHFLRGAYLQDISSRLNPWLPIRSEIWTYFRIDGHWFALRAHAMHTTLWKITVWEEHDAITLKLAGRFVEPSIDELERVWRSLALTLGSKTLRVDLREITYVNSHGLGEHTEIRKNTASIFLADSPITNYWAEQALGELSPQPWLCRKVNEQ